MDTMTPKQRDIDQRLRNVAGLGLSDWIGRQRDRGMSWGSMSIQLHGLTGDTVPDETLRRWGDGRERTSA